MMADYNTSSLEGAAAAERNRAEGAPVRGLNPLLDKLMHELLRPEFVYRMARAMIREDGAPYQRDIVNGRVLPWAKGAPMRAEDAAIQLDRLVLAYAADRLTEYWGEYGVGTDIAQAMEWLRDPGPLS